MQSHNTFQSAGKPMVLIGSGAYAHDLPTDGYLRALAGRLYGKQAAKPVPQPAAMPEAWEMQLDCCSDERLATLLDVKSFENARPDVVGPSPVAKSQLQVFGGRRPVMRGGRLMRVVEGLGRDPLINPWVVLVTMVTAVAAAYGLLVILWRIGGRS